MAVEEEAAATRDAARAVEELQILKESGLEAENVKAAAAEAEQLAENAGLAAATEATLKVIHVFQPFFNFFLSCLTMCLSSNLFTLPELLSCSFFSFILKVKLCP